jgi:PPOX class probable F420-dependent enzyme
VGLGLTLRIAIMDMGAEITGSKQVSLTTYRKDGTPVSTAVWHVLDGGILTIVTEADSWKVKRIRNNPQVEVTACDLRGRITPGAQPIAGTARLLDEAGTSRARDLLARRYLMSRVGNFFAKLFRLKRKPLIGIAVTF